MWAPETTKVGPFLIFILAIRVGADTNGAVDITTVLTTGRQYSKARIAISNFVLGVLLGDLGKGKRNVTILPTCGPAGW